LRKIRLIFKLVYLTFLFLLCSISFYIGGSVNLCYKVEFNYNKTLFVIPLFLYFLFILSKISYNCLKELNLSIRQLLLFYKINSIKAIIINLFFMVFFSLTIILSFIRGFWLWSGFEFNSSIIWPIIYLFINLFYFCFSVNIIDFFYKLFLPQR
jgi:hypothetical protein